MSTEAE
jgi:hypothetical protein